MRKLLSYGKVQRFIGSLIRGRKFFVKSSFSQFLNVGCGSNTKDNFINLDYHWNPKIDICWDIEKKSYPIEDNSLIGVYTEHCLEHISFINFEVNCREFFRMLKSQGVVRIVMPDGELYFDIYHDGKNGGSRRMPHEDSYPTRMARINGLFRNHGHRFIYDFETVAHVLEKVGFVNVKKETFGGGRMSDLLIDSEWRADESLYVEASKP